MRPLLAFVLGFCFSASAQADQLARAGTEFQDCPTCPKMVVLPQQSFMMGSPNGEKGRSKNEGPRRKVTIAYPLAVAKFEISFDEWDACLEDGGCRGHKPEDEGRARGTLPVIDVDWFDAHAYIEWLNHKTGKKYRLLTEAEWEYAAKAGADTTYSWGAEASHEHANYGQDECCGTLVKGRDQWEFTSPQGSFPPNAFGLHDLSGNLWEWVEDCWSEDPSKGPTDGSARMDGECALRIMKGGSWASMPVRIRAAFRDAFGPDDRGNIIGFRVARTL